MTHCLITGATGFVGPHVVRRMLDAGWDVVSLSRHPELTLSERHTHIALDLHETDTIDDVLRACPATHLIHLAWEATPGTFWQSTENFRWISSSAFLLDAFQRHGGKRAILAGSCAEYKWQNQPLVEDSSETESANLYAASKLAFKGLAETIAKDISLVWARIFFPFGPDEDDSKLTSYIFREIAAGRLPVFQSPDRAVDMIHVTDVAKAFERLTAAKMTGVVNIASGAAVLPGQIALECARLLGKDDLIKPLETALEGVVPASTLQGDNRRLLSVWDDAPMLSLSEGLESYLK